MRTSSCSVWVVSSYLKFNGQFSLCDAAAGNHGSCIHHLGLDICFDEYNCHDSLQALLIQGISHCLHLVTPSRSSDESN